MGRSKSHTVAGGRLIDLREREDVELVELSLVHRNALGLLVWKHVHGHTIQQHI